MSGLQLEGRLTIAHLDQNCANNDPDNLVWLYHTHHWMYDAGLYHIDAIQLLNLGTDPQRSGSSGSDEERGR